MKKLFRIEMTAFKSFYVEADSEDEALELGVVEDEMDARGEKDWEHNETRAIEQGEHDAERIRTHKKRSILA